MMIEQWHYVTDLGTIIVQSQTDHVCVLSVGQEDKANLIIAAPDLLAYAEKEEERFKHERACWNCPSHCKISNDLRSETYALRQVALAKAKGGQL